MEEQHDARATVYTAFFSRLQNQKLIKKICQVFLIGLGSLVAGIGALGASSWSLNNFTVMATSGLLCVFIGTAYIVFSGDESDNLESAFKTLRANDILQDSFADLYRSDLHFRSKAAQFQALYSMYAAGRAVIEQALVNGAADEASMIPQVLKFVRSDMRIALGFGMSDTWTIVVYKNIRKDDGYQYLKPIAHDRSIECDLKDAREWKEGIGVGGMALAKDDQVVAPDILAPAAASLFSLNNGTFRQEDLVRYRSLVAVPVNVVDDDRPWGVVLASSNVANHFQGGTERDEELLDRTDPMRVLADLVAVAVATCRINHYIEEKKRSKSGNVD